LAIGDYLTLKIEITDDLNAMAEYYNQIAQQQNLTQSTPEWNSNSYLIECQVY